MRLGTPQFAGERLREAREARGLNGVMLSELLGVSRQAVSQYEKNLQTPAPAIMERICTVLGLPKSFFLERTTERIGELFFRSFASATKSERIKQLQKQKWRHRIIRLIREYVSWPQMRLPCLYAGDPMSLTTNDVEELAAQLRRRFGIGDGPIENLSLLVENSGAVVVRTCFGAKSLDAFSEWSNDDDLPYFILNADKRSAVRSRLDLAHELAHMTIHRGVGNPSHPMVFQRIEAQAYRFAGAFLAPARTFSRNFRIRFVDDMIAIKRLWGMSISAIARRANELGLMTDSAYRRIMTEIGKRGWRSREPLDDELICEEPRFLRRSVNLILEESILLPSDFERIGAGSLRDVESCLGLPFEYLDRSPQSTLRLSR